MIPHCTNVQNTLTYLRQGRYFTDDGKIIHPSSKPSQFRRTHLDIFYLLLIHLIKTTEAGRLVRVEGVIIHKHPVPVHPIVSIQKCIQLVHISDADEYRTTNARFIQLRLNTTPLLGVAPAVGSSHVTKVDYDVGGARCHLAGFDRIVDADEISRGVDYHRGADGVGAVGNSHQGWSFVCFGWNVAHGLGAVVAAACSEGNRTS